MRKNSFLFSLLSIVGIVAIAIGLFLPAWNLVIANNVVSDYGFFNDWSGSIIALTNLETTWAVLAMISALVGLAALVIYALIAILQHFKIIKGWGGLMKLFAWLALIAFVAILVFGLIFTISSDSSTLGVANLVNSMKFAAGFWLALIGTGVGAFFALMGAGSKK